MSVAAFLFGTAGFAGAETVTVGAENAVTVDGSVRKLVSAAPTTGDPAVTPPPAGTGLMWEWESSGGTWKACLCRMFSFRALQAVMVHTAATDLSSAGTKIIAGWNTEGPEELFVENMPWVEGVNFSYGEGLTENSQMTLDDVWFVFSINGAGVFRVSASVANYAFTPDTTHEGYHADWDFFDYRTYFKTHATMDAEKKYFRDVVRPQIVANFKNGASFEVETQAIDKGSGGGCSVGAVGAGFPLLLAPLGLFMLKNR